MMFADRVTLGLIRLAVLGIAGFIVVSVPALVLAGRWLKAFGTQSIAADAAEDADKALEKQQTELQAARQKVKILTRQRDDAIQIAQALIDEKEEKED